MRLHSIHSKTTPIADEDLPFNASNVLLHRHDLEALFEQTGLTGMRFTNVNIYRNAFVHRSYCTMRNTDFASGNERCPEDCLPLQDMSYERLEYLGDAVLGMAVADYLYERYPDQSEGFLSQMRSKIVNGRMLGQLSNKLGFGRWVIISKQVEQTGGRTNYKTLEDVFEAFIGALYTDFQSGDAEESSCAPPGYGCGYHVAKRWITYVMESHIDFAELVQARTNYKDALVRYMQNMIQDCPQFLEVSVAGKHASRTITCCVKNKAGVVLGTATASSRKDAENMAAKAALTFLGCSS